MKKQPTISLDGEQESKACDYLFKKWLKEAAGASRTKQKEFMRILKAELKLVYERSREFLLELQEIGVINLHKFEL